MQRTKGPGTSKLIAPPPIATTIMSFQSQGGGKIAIAEAARNIACSGAQPIAVTDGLELRAQKTRDLLAV